MLLLLFLSLFFIVDSMTGVPYSSHSFPSFIVIFNNNSGTCSSNYTIPLSHSPRITTVNNLFNSSHHIQSVLFVLYILQLCSSSVPVHGNYLNFFNSFYVLYTIHVPQFVKFTFSHIDEYLDYLYSNGLQIMLQVTFLCLYLWALLGAYLWGHFEKWNCLV